MRRVVAVLLALLALGACDAKPPTAEDLRSRQVIRYINCYGLTTPCP